MKSLQRKWINQPSTLQPHHELHGVNVLYDEKSKRIYFLSGDVISQNIDPLALSDGWLETKALNVDLDLLAEQANMVGAAQDESSGEAKELLNGVLEMLCDIEMYLRQDGEILLKEHKA